MGRILSQLAPNVDILPETHLHIREKRESHKCIKSVSASGYGENWCGHLIEGLDEDERIIMRPVSVKASNIYGSVTWRRVLR